MLQKVGEQERGRQGLKAAARQLANLVTHLPRSDLRGLLNRLRRRLRRAARRAPQGLAVLPSGCGIRS
jgi:hypothetical protein